MIKNNLHLLALLVFTILLNSCSNIVKGDIYILPKDYQGCVLVVFNVQNSTEEKMDDKGNRLFVIPPSGILETQSMPKKGLKLISKFYYSNSYELKEIKYIGTGEWNYNYNDTLKVASTMEYGEDFKPWKAFVIGEFGDNSICNNRHSYITNYLNKFSRSPDGARMIR